MSGCTAVGPNYHPPKLALPANWTEIDAHATSNATIQLTQWWTSFNDPTLNSLVERGVNSNLNLQLAAARLREARALRAGALWDLAPTIDPSASYLDQQRSRNALTFTTSNLVLHSTLYDAHFDASWEIDVFGGQRRALEAANAAYQAVFEEQRSVLVSLLSEIARNYVELRGFQRRLEIAHHSIEIQRDAAEITQLRFDAGIASELDVAQAKALLATTESQVPTIEAGLRQAMLALAVLLGQPPGALVTELSAEGPIPATPPEVPVGLPSDLLRRRPDIRAAERQVAAATARIGVETAELFPKFSLVGTGGLQSLSVSDWFTTGSRYWSAGPTVKWRILEFGRVWSNIRAANAREQQALIAYQQTVLNALQDVESSLVAYSKEQVRYRTLREAVTANRQAVDLAKELYQSGLTDFLNVVDAERSLYSAEDAFVQSERTVTVNLVTLYKALGGGWEIEKQLAKTK
jgi:NodT family efflux transporter outer membrane factor (OMF) lipoprotein